MKNKSIILGNITLILVFICVAMLPAGAEQSARRERQIDTGPQLGEAAPVFILKSLGGKENTDLSAFRGKMPVVLFFGSYT